MSDTLPSRDPVPHGGWFVVSQVKSNRVVYFTDDPQYQPVMDGDWYFVSHYLGELPAEMTLRNCWRWRFNGGIFLDAKDPRDEDAPLRLMEANRAALHKLLRERIDEVRRPWAPSCTLGETLRAAKLTQAQRYLAQPAATDPDGCTFALLEGVAAARGITMTEAALLVVERATAVQQGLVESEHLRERFAQAIDVALTQEDLLSLRAGIMGDIDPLGAAKFPIAKTAMTPEQWDEVLGDTDRTHEAARLRTQLREAVNTRRMRIHDGYVDSDTLVRHKAKLAQTLLNNEGKIPAGIDFSLLSGFAEARNLKLEDAARLMMGKVSEAEAILRRTERDKDRMLARIDAARTLRDFKTVGKDVEALARRTADD